MFRAQVAEFYRARGYDVRENPRVRGTSESIYAVEMVAMGPLGALLISFGDAGGVDAAEISRVRTLARDIGATPVIATAELTPELRRMAAQFAVVVLDNAVLAQPDDGLPTVPLPRDLRHDLDQHPWPASGRARPEEPVNAGMDPQDVDVLLSQLGGNKPAAKPRAAVPGLWKTGVHDAAPQPKAPGPPPAAAAESAPPPRPAAPPATQEAARPKQPFSWLAQGEAPKAEARLTVEDLLGEPPMPAAPAAARPAIRAAPPTLAAPDEAPLFSHEATIATRNPTLAERAGDLRDDLGARVGDRGGWVKFGLWVGGAALGLFLLIRLLTG